MKRKIKILYVAAEISPYANAGGLGEVGRSLPPVLSKSSEFEVCRVMPLHRQVSNKLKYIADFPVPMEQGFETCIIKCDIDCNDTPTYFVGNDRYFNRNNIYGYEDDGFRYFFFCRAVVEMLKHISYRPDIIQTNDWHTGFLPLLIKKEFPEIKTIYTIHNIAYHGFIPASYLGDMLSEQERSNLGWPEWLNFMKAGIIYADRLTTVSPGYSNEIRRPRQGFGMEELIEQRPEGIIGILNGIDTIDYDPEHDGILTYPYTFNKIGEKHRNRTELRTVYSLSDIDVPLVAMVTRLDYSKGIDLILKAIALLGCENFQFIILGSGNPGYQKSLSSLADIYPRGLIADFDYSSEKAKKLYAAADIYLMPSINEPCGIGQLYAMRYGAVPVVNPVGGLKDTVLDDSTNPENSSGFYMEEWSSEALASSLNKAIRSYHTPEWAGYIKNCMSYDSSWDHSVAEYHKLYRDILQEV